MTARHLTTMNDVRFLAAVSLFASMALLVSCGNGEPGPASAGEPVPDAAERNLVPADYAGRFAVTATVLADEDHGPQLCGTVADSYPPQCSGPAVVGWDWDSVEAESAASTRWGNYQLVGTWDGERFTLTEPATPADPTAIPDRRSIDFTTPCPEPAGGWRVEDSATTARQTALTRAAASPHYAGGWLDYLDGPPAELESAPEDSGAAVLNLRFTSDLDRHERKIREVYGGPLCVTAADRTEAELREIQRAVIDSGVAGFGVGPDVVQNAVIVEVLVATEEQQAELDARYGVGAVLLYGYLQPID